MSHRKRSHRWKRPLAKLAREDAAEATVEIIEELARRLKKCFTRKNVHFVGIGGIGMSGIAEVLCDLGFSVSGSDIKKVKQYRPSRKNVRRAISEGHRRIECRRCAGRRLFVVL